MKLHIAVGRRCPVRTVTAANAAVAARSQLARLLDSYD